MRKKIDKIANSNVNITLNTQFLLKEKIKYSK